MFVVNEIYTDCRTTHFGDCVKQFHELGHRSTNIQICILNFILFSCIKDKSKGKITDHTCSGILITRSFRDGSSYTCENDTQYPDHHRKKTILKFLVPVNVVQRDLGLMFIRTIKNNFMYLVITDQYCRLYINFSLSVTNLSY